MTYTPRKQQTHTMTSTDHNNDAKVTTLRNLPYEAQERAAIYEYEAGMTREQAEARVIAELAEEKKA